MIPVRPPNLAPLPLAPKARPQEFAFEGRLNFENRAVLHGKGVNFSNGKSFEVKADDFVELGPLGVGTYGEVKAVQHKASKALMAQKRIPVSDSEVGLKQILTELDVLNKSSSPYIVSFYGAYFHDSFVFYCIELMDAGSLDKLLLPQGIPVDVVGFIAACVIKGLLYLKQQLHVIHRDIRPSNILLSTQGTVKLCDFGVSGQLEKSLAHSFTGCLQYMAPERITSMGGQSLQYGIQSDIWSLGLTVLEAATGKFPYAPAANIFDQLQRIVQEPSPSLSPDEYPEELCSFVNICLQKDVSRRTDYHSLSGHPFLTKYESADIRPWVTSHPALRPLPSAPLQ